MKIKTAALISIPFFTFLVLVGMGMVSKRPVHRVNDGKVISFDSMIHALSGDDFVFIGEIHDDPDTHALQLDAVKAFHESGRLEAVGLEMFRKDSQASLDSWVMGTLPVDKFVPVYYDNWRIAWPLYRDIFLYARKHKIPLVGLNIASEISSAVAKKGFSALGDAEKRGLPPAVSCNVDRTYMEFIKKAYAGHTPRDDRKFMNFCEAQLVWDKSMAWNLITYRDRHPGKTILVLAGVGHAWKRGIPEQVLQQSSYSFKVVMPVVPDQIDTGTATVSDADYIVLD